MRLPSKQYINELLDENTCTNVVDCPQIYKQTSTMIKSHRNFYNTLVALGMSKGQFLETCMDDNNNERFCRTKATKLIEKQKAKEELAYQEYINNQLNGRNLEERTKKYYIKKIKNKLYEFGKLPGNALLLRELISKMNLRVSIELKEKQELLQTIHQLEKLQISFDKNYKKEYQNNKKTASHIKKAVAILENGNDSSSENGNDSSSENGNDSSLENGHDSSSENEDDYYEKTATVDHYKKPKTTQCTKTTQAGLRCKNTSMKNKEYCHMHRHRK